jgi:hypothetical protein
MKTIDLKLPPIHHRLESRVCEYPSSRSHLREAWAELLFADEDQDAKVKRNTESG